MAQDDDSQTSLTRSLSARLRRKEQVARGETVPEMPEDTLPPGMADQEAESDEEAALSDEELLAKYGVEDPEVIEDEDKLDSLLQGQFPDRIRQMALRRMWRLNPLFRFADEMVEYGENYTDAATVIDGMQTAYQVGKGYLQKAFDAVEDDEEDVTGAGTPAEQQETGLADGAPGEPAKDEYRDTAQTSSDRQTSSDQQISSDQQDPAVVADADDAGRPAAPALIEDEPESAPPPRPRRMTFRKPA